MVTPGWVGCGAYSGSEVQGKPPTTKEKGVFSTWRLVGLSHVMDGWMMSGTLRGGRDGNLRLLA